MRRFFFLFCFVFVDLLFGFLFLPRVISVDGFLVVLLFLFFTLLFWLRRETQGNMNNA